MKITKITTQKRPGRYNIFLDGQFGLAIGEDLLISYQLTKGQELTSQQVQQLLQAETKDYAYNQALNYLSYQLRSTAEVKTYLRKQDVSEKIISEIILELQQKQYLDDVEFARSFVRTEIKVTLDGPQKVNHKLQQKQVAAAIIQQALTLYSPELQLQNATKLAQKCAQQNRRQPLKKQQQKIKQRLLTNGFSFDLIQQVFQDLSLENNETQELEMLQKTIAKLWPRYQTKAQAKQKLYAALLRRGFTSSQIMSQLEKLN